MGINFSSSSSTPVGANPPPGINPYNDAVWEFCNPGGTPDAEILFFHGLQPGDYENAFWKTWLARNHDNEVWPKAWLGKSFPKARILSISCNLSVKANSGQLDMYRLGENLVNDIIMDSHNVGQSCPVILIGHSLGGIAIKQFLLSAGKECGVVGKSGENMIRKINKFLENVKGVFYYATPHGGCGILDFANLIPGASQYIKLLQTLDKERERINSDFSKLRETGKIKAYAIAEGLCTRYWGFDAFVVEEPSARRDIDIFYTATNANHFDVCKPEGRTSGIFVKLCEFIQSLKEVKMEELPSDNIQQIPKGAVDLDLSVKAIQEEVKVEEVQEVPFHNIQQIPKGAVGLDLLVKAIQEELLEHLKVGIVGMGGSGKTTLSKAVFNKVGPMFEYNCYVHDVKGIEGHAEKLEEKVWKKHMYHNGKKMLDGEGGCTELMGKKVLLIFDNVNSERDLEVLSNIMSGVSTKSQCVFTSRNLDLLKRYDDIHIYKMKLLSKPNANQLFVKYAFSNQEIEPVLLDHVNSIVEKCDGLPLSIEILAKYLKTTRNETLWKQALEALEKAEMQRLKLDELLWAKLSVSYEALQDDEKQVFLDATTIFSALGWVDTPYVARWTLREAKVAWDATYGLGSPIWQTLIERSLVYDVADDEPIKVHEQLLSLGKMIASKSNKDGKYRVWDHGNKEASALLRSITIHHDQEIYSFRLPCDYDHVAVCNDPMENLGHVGKFTRSCIQKLVKVQYLDLEVLDLELDHEDEENEALPVLENLVLLRSPGLQFFQRLLFDPACLPRLAVLKLRGYSNMNALPISFGQLASLKILVIAHADALEILPNEFGNLSQLEQLIFHSCGKLETLPDTLGGLCKLQHLELSDTFNLHSLPASFGSLSALKHLKFGSCYELRDLPKTFGQLYKLEHLEFHRCVNLGTLPDTFENLFALIHIEINCNKKLQTLPKNFGNLSALKYLAFHDCQSLYDLPMSFGDLSALEHLELSRCKSLHILPDSFGHLEKVQVLRIVECRKIEMLPFSAGQLMALRHLAIVFVGLTSIPDCIESFPSLKILDLGILPFLKGLPPWLEALVTREGLAMSRKIFHVQNGGVSLQQESNMSWKEQLTFRTGHF